MDTREEQLANHMAALDAQIASLKTAITHLNEADRALKLVQAVLGEANGRTAHASTGPRHDG